jgi:two-component sensor histidine kinase
MIEEPSAMRILVIDDNPDDRELEIREVYAVFPDAQVLELTDLESFERALAAGEPNLVLTDLDLRWSSGREILSTVKAQYPGCPVVMFTGTGDETIAVDLMKAGLDDYVVKSPRQLSRLRASLKIAVELANSRAALSNREMHLAAALASQQIIVRELHHRVKNNLQTITSLLQLRSRTADANTRAYLDEIAGRMEALGAVQSRIYDTAQLDRVDFGAALADIAASLVNVHYGSIVTLTTRFATSLDLEVTRAMPLGLVCYEVILNAMKHAWPDGSGGALTVEIISGETRRISIADNGIGFAQNEVTHGLGAKLIRSLAREARVDLSTSSHSGAGTVVLLTLQ